MAIFFNRKLEKKIFCVSMQKTGTTSVGFFFEHFKYKLGDWYCSRRNNWSTYWEHGNFESIFNSQDFINNQVFEDDPWWFPEFYKILYHRFPNSKFILFERDSNAWFNSMMKHSAGKTLGNTKQHCKVFRREEDFYKLSIARNKLYYDEKKIDNLLSLKGYEDHYKTIYEMHNREVIDFFNKNAPESLFVCQLEDPLKWKKLGVFIGIDVDRDLEFHANKSN